MGSRSPVLPLPSPQRSHDLSDPRAFAVHQEVAAEELGCDPQAAETEATRTAMLATSCQTGTPVMPSLSITRTGALNGTMLNTIQTGLLGKNMSRDMNRKGDTAVRATRTPIFEHALGLATRRTWCAAQLWRLRQVSSCLQPRTKVLEKPGSFGDGVLRFAL